MSRKLTSAIRSFFTLELNFISESQENELICELMPKLKYSRWNEGHFDGKIYNYREFLASNLHMFPKLQEIKDRVSNFMIDREMLPVHVLELRHDGQILPHIDNKDYSGSIIAGLSLQRDSILTLSDSSESEKILLPRRSFYRQTDDLRFNYEHSISFQGLNENTLSRISLLFRDIYIKN